ncbi:beta-glucuronidase-like isoform X2 [Varroa jacobsoni]|uniref:beta-glucuronidase-like isoform X2 n=1 Tax=Varroa jacobsoni TaxID=62625 RepID=UPI000BF33FD4|nr:beta-glucuronidase-like isoform X2 [Varroa jacobsoni]
MRRVHRSSDREPREVFFFKMCRRIRHLMGLRKNDGAWCYPNSHALLYPREGPTRQVKRLDGVWNFKLAPINNPDQGFVDAWHSDAWNKMGLSYEPMPVPASYNDVGQDKALRDHVGWAWYQKAFYVPTAWKSKRIMLYFGSAHYNTIVFVNGKLVLQHAVGHLPFEAQINNFLVSSSIPNILTVAINNTLTYDTIPQGTLILKINSTGYPPFFYRNTGNFDFFNYAGIHRSVFLYTTEQVYVYDVDVNTVKADKKESIISFNVAHTGSSALRCRLSVRDRQDNEVLVTENCSGLFKMKNAQLWWTHDLSKEPGYQYIMMVNVLNGTKLMDSYPVKFGIRTIEVNGARFLLNGEDFYFTGFGKHEDSDIRGRGLDNALNVKDMKLVKWLGANSFRTSHYPYSEELMDLADEMGIAVIDETPAVGLMRFSSNVLQLHKDILTDLIDRDKNRPSVFVWSVANEPESNQNSSRDYFQQVVKHVKSLDKYRPVSAALSVGPDEDQVGQFMDVIMFNKYVSWYSDSGELDVIYSQIIDYCTRWYTKHKKPVMISEYGADTVSGLHVSPSWMFSEDYQSELLIKHHRAFDQLRSQGWFIGEHIWNFADFMTAQGTTRVIGNRKGVLTRQRQPKAAAKILRCRYYMLARINTTDDSFYCPVPSSYWSYHTTQ